MVLTLRAQGYKTSEAFHNLNLIWLKVRKKNTTNKCMVWHHIRFGIGQKKQRPSSPCWGQTSKSGIQQLYTHTHTHTHTHSGIQQLHTHTHTHTHTHKSITGSRGSRAHIFRLRWARLSRQVVIRKNGFCLSHWTVSRATKILLYCYIVLMNEFSSVQFSRSVASNSLQPHESQHARPPCPSQTPRMSISV